MSSSMSFLNRWLSKWSVSQVYLAIMRVLNVFYALAFVGVFSVVPDYVHWLSWAMSLAVSLLLISWFQPYRATKHVLTDGDDAVLFGSGMIILTDVALTGASRIPVISDWARSAQTRVDGVRDVVQARVAGTEIVSTDGVAEILSSGSSSSSGKIPGAAPESSTVAVYRPTKRE